jgi:hypothetical protein
MKWKRQREARDGEAKARANEQASERERRKKNLKSMIWKNVISSQEIDLVSQH